MPLTKRPRSPLPAPARRFLALVGLTLAGLLATASPALAFAPTATPATELDFTSATLDGTVNPEGVQLGDCHFEYSYRSGQGIFYDPNPGYTLIAPCIPVAASIPADSTAHPVSAKISGLTAGREYHFRLVVADSEGHKVLSADQVFTARPAHVFSTSIAGSGSAALSAPSDVDVDQQSHDIYVADPARFRVEKFTSSGDFLLMFGQDVNRTKVEQPGSTRGERNLCTAASGDLCQSGTQGTAPGAFQAEQHESAISGIRLFLAVDQLSGDVYVGDPGDSVVQKFSPDGQLITAWAQGGQLSSGTPGHYSFALPGLSWILVGVAVDPQGNLVVAAGARQRFDFTPDGALISLSFIETGIVPTGIAVDGAGFLYRECACYPEGSIWKIPFGRQSSVGAIPIRSRPYAGLRVDPRSRDLYVTEDDGSVARFPGSCNPPNEDCAPVDVFGFGSLSAPEGLAVDEGSGTVYVADTGHGRVAVFSPVPYLPGAAASAQPLTTTSESLTGAIDPAAAGPITACRFEWGVDEEEVNEYGNPLKKHWVYVDAAPCDPPGLPYPAAGPTAVHAFAATGLQYGTKYHYRLLAQNENGTTASFDQTFETLPHAPLLGGESASHISSDTALIHDNLTPGGGDDTYHTSFRVQYLTQQQFESAQPEPWSAASSTAAVDAGSARTSVAVTQQLRGLAPDTTYHYRALATNASGTVHGPGRTFNTFPRAAFLDDPCPNAHVRQQTSAALLLDCRAYELVSAADAAGYDVESSLIPGQSPQGGYPRAHARVLYGVHNGGIPGTGNPTNHGVDPYVATRGEAGWSTAYVGIPADGTPSASPFGSPLLEADSALDTFAFGGTGICSPCFADGSTGVPLHLPGGQLIQGMAGPEDPGSGAEPDGYLAKHLSADGTHFVFGSTSKFTPGGNDGGDVSIYDRDLKTGVTHVVSKTPGGATMTGPGIGELDLSEDGGRIVIGQGVSEDSLGNVYWHLFINLGDSSAAIDLTPGATHGALYDGMTADGSRLFFTTVDPLTGDDEDTSADLYMAEVSGSSATLTRISAAPGADAHGPGNTDSCDPVANSAREHWNTTGSAPNCDTVAIGGGGGVASAEGTVYFLSPELLDGPGNGVPDAPNLYIARSGSAPHFLTTLESSLSGPQPPLEGRVLRGDFGSFAAAAGLAVDHATGDVYVLDDEAQAVEKFDRDGNPVNFTASGPSISANKLTGPGAEGTGDLENGSSEVKSVTTTKGAFSAGEEISGAGIPSGTTITSVNGGGVLEISQPAEATAAGVELSAHQSFAQLSFLGVPRQLAVDNDPSSPSYGDLYVPDFSGQAVHKFASSGEYLGSIPVSTPSGVAVDQANGHVYVTSFFAGTAFVFDAEGNPAAPTSFSIPPFTPTAIAVDNSGTTYVAAASGTTVYDSAGNETGTLDPNPSQGVSVDSSTGDVYVNEGGQIVEFDSAGDEIAAVTQPGDLSGSLGLAVDTGGDLYATDDAGKAVAHYGPLGLLSSPLIDNPVVLDSVGEAGTRHTADFQLTPDGEFAAFPSTLALAGAEEEPNGHPVIYRYAAGSDALACVSCLLTQGTVEGDAALAPDGLSLTDDGRVFFDSTVPLASGDTDNRRDVYEWEPLGTGNCQSGSPTFSHISSSCLALVSAGTSTFDSGLLSASADGRDAYFFTRDSLAPQDANGPTMKIYDAREGGGFPFGFPPVGCKASDECHGPSSASPGPLPVSSEAGTEHHFKPCRKGFLPRHGRCVKRHKPTRHHKRAGHHRGAAK